MPNTPERIAFRSTQSEGQFPKPRWTEMSLDYDPAAADGNAFIANITGKSSVPTETDRVNEVSYHTLDLALVHFDDSAPARSIIRQAQVWAERKVHAHEARKTALAPAMIIPTDDATALTMLYGAEAVEQRGFVARVARDFGLGESSVRMALKNGTGIRVPLVAIANLIDRAKLGGEADRG